MKYYIILFLGQTPWNINNNNYKIIRPKYTECTILPIDGTTRQKCALNFKQSEKYLFIYLKHFPLLITILILFILDMRYTI